MFSFFEITILNNKGTYNLFLEMNNILCIPQYVVLAWNPKKY